MNYTQEMSKYNFVKGYSKWNDSKNRYETWDEAVDRVMDMHKTKYKDKIEKSDRLVELIDYATHAYKDKFCLASQRSLQFGGDPILKKNGRIFNCLTSYADRCSFFQDAMWWLLQGGGVGFSVQVHHTNKLSTIKKRSEEIKEFVIPDTIEGWSDAIGVLLSSYFVDGQTFPEYSEKKVHFDFSLIRPEGSFISGGFKAPGPDGLRASLIKIESVIESRLSNGESRLHPIDVYDIVMHASDAVLSGGIRRSATICLFSPEDKEMLAAKTGDWFVKNPQRGRSNNSALLLRDETDKALYEDLFESVRQFGEPGIVWSDSKEFLFNPCVEIGFMPVSPNGESAFQGCNLTECNGGKMNNMESAKRAVKGATIIGTLQAGYTDFEYGSKESRATFEKEALLGVSITGWQENPDFLFDEENLKELAEYAKEINEEVAALIEINKAARITCTKPAGNSSVLLGTSSGIHPHHSKRYFRNMQANINEDVPKEFKRINPDAVETSVWSASGRDVVISFPVIAPEGAKFKDELLGVKLLDNVKLAQNSWVEHGTREELGNHPMLRHNISNTITVDDWDEVKDYVWANRHSFAGISFLGMSGDKDYAQAPFTEVKTEDEIVKEYGVASMFASGLIVDALNAYGNDLWVACSVADGSNPDGLSELEHETSRNALKRDLIRRIDKFAAKYFKGDMKKTTYLLKDVYLLHKWENVTKSFKAIDWENADIKPKYIDVNTTGAQACSGGVCDIV